MNYKRILLKLSGEALMGPQQYGINAASLEQYVRDIKTIVEKKVELAIVIGGGNIFRGIQGRSEGIDQAQGDYMGMLATIINSVALQSALEKSGIETKHLSGMPVDRICESMSSKKAIEYLEDGKVIIISGGTGNPYFTTDSAAALRALEISADVILKGTRVDGVYSADPEVDPKAIKYNNISFDEAYEKELSIMDMTAFTLCKENNLPIIVFNMKTEGNLGKIIAGENIGTTVSNME